MASASTVATLTHQPALPAQPPQRIGRFVVTGEIGRGANGVVYAAHDPMLGRDVAIKAIRLAVNDEVRQRAEANFIKEARAVAGLNHPHIVTVFDAGRTDELAYIAMERLLGRDLHEYLHSGARLGVRQAAALMARIADAVHYAHKRGLIHRDIKPSNIFLSRDMRPKVLDFGVALPRRERDLSQPARLVGTPNYMSPEQAQGRSIDARSDVFSLGAILYEMLSGRRAFDGASVEEILQSLVDGEPTPLQELRQDIPEELLAIVRKAMARDIEARYQTAGEFRNDLAAFAGTRDGDAPLRPAQPPLARSRLATWSMRAAMLLLALATALWLAPEWSPEPPPPLAEPAAEPQVPLPSPAEPPVAETTLPAPEPADETRTASPPPAPSHGQVALAIAPWGEVLVDGEPRGVSPPLTEIRLPPGTYAIEVRNGDLPPLRASVEVRPGQTHTLQHRF